MKLSLSMLLLLAAVVPASAQYTLPDDFKVAKGADRVDAPSVKPPEGAIVLFDGKTLDGWTKRDKPKEKASWKIADGIATVGGGDIVTEKLFDGSFKLHVEFRVPYMSGSQGQGRGNSGVYLQGRYEVQILDSYGLDSKDNDCGGIYGISKPQANACKAPAVWQTYDIDFKAPIFKDGKKVELGVITVLHNGVAIHKDQKLTKDFTTSGMSTDPSTPGPIMLQDHGNPVQFRNVWLKKD